MEVVVIDIVIDCHSLIVIGMEMVIIDIVIDCHSLGKYCNWLLNSQDVYCN
jgi:hypothetical protein